MLRRALRRAGFTLGIGAGYAEDEHDAIGLPLPPPPSGSIASRRPWSPSAGCSRGETVTTDGSAPTASRSSPGCARSRPIRCRSSSAAAATRVLRDRRPPRRHRRPHRLLLTSTRDRSLTHFSADGAPSSAWICVQRAGAGPSRAACGSRPSCSSSGSPTTGEAAAEPRWRPSGARRRDLTVEEVLASPVPAPRARPEEIAGAAPRADRAACGIETWTIFAGRPIDAPLEAVGGHRRGAAAPDRAVAGAVGNVGAMFRRSALTGSEPAWPSWASTRCSCRWAPTCRTSRGTRPCRSSGSRCSCCPSTARRRSSCPRLEAPRVVERPEVFALRAWDETDDPIAIVAGLVGKAGTARHRRSHLGAVRRRPPARAARPPGSPGAARSIGPLRARKDAAEVEALRRAGRGRRPGGGRAAGAATSSWSGAPRRRCRPSWAAGCGPRGTTG